MTWQTTSFSKVGRSTSEYGPRARTSEGREYNPELWLLQHNSETGATRVTVGYRVGVNVVPLEEVPGLVSLETGMELVRLAPRNGIGGSGL